MYALVAERRGTSQMRTYSSLTRYNPESNSWEDVSSFDWDSRTGICIIHKDNFVYFLGGRRRSTCLSDAHRYDLTTNKWEKIAEMNEERANARGAAAHGNIFVIGAVGQPFGDKLCEAYNETIGDEWQLIASFKIPDGFSEGGVVGLMCVDEKLHAIVQYSVESWRYKSRHEVSAWDNLITIECYDPVHNQWKKKTEAPKRIFVMVAACSMTVFKGSQFLRKVSSSLKCNSLIPPESQLDQEIPTDKGAKRFCLIM